MYFILFLWSTIINYQHFFFFLPTLLSFWSWKLFQVGLCVASTYIHPFLSNSFLSVTKNYSRIILYFFCSAQESSTSWLGSFSWKMVVRNQGLGVGFAHWKGGIIVSRPLQGTDKGNMHAHPHLCFYICVYKIKSLR
jgi:hypothetical protein